MTAQRRRGASPNPPKCTESGDDGARRGVAAQRKRVRSRSQTIHMELGDDSMRHLCAAHARGLSLSTPIFFLFKDSPTAPKDHQPPTANRQLPTATNHKAESVPVNVRFCWRCKPFSCFFSYRTALLLKPGRQRGALLSTCTPIQPLVTPCRRIQPRLTGGRKLSFYRRTP